MSAGLVGSWFRVNCRANRNNHVDTRVADWLHCHLPQDGSWVRLDGAVRAVAVHDFIKLSNTPSSYANKIQTDHDNDTIEQVNKFTPFGSLVSHLSEGYQSQNRQNIYL